MANVQVIRRRKSDPWGDAMGALGQGLSGFASGYMGKQQMDMAKQNSSAQQRMMERLLGKDGSGISTQGSVNDQFNSALDDTLAGNLGEAAGGAPTGTGDLPGTAQNVTGGGAAPAAMTPALAGLGGIAAGAAVHKIKGSKGRKKSDLGMIADMGLDPGGSIIEILTGEPWKFSPSRLFNF